MANPVVHFEVIGPDPEASGRFYESLFGWKTTPQPTVAPDVSDPGRYGFLEAPDGVGIPGGIGGGDGFEARVLFYVGVEDVEAALARAEALGATRLFGPSSRSDEALVVGQFRDPGGRVVGVAGPR